MATERYTMRSRRQPDVPRGDTEPRFSTRFRVGELAPKPAKPKRRPRPCGDFDRASIKKLCDALAVHGGTPNHSKYRRVKGATAILTYLTGFDGTTWQQRWDASGLDDGKTHISSLLSDPTVGIFYSNELESGNALTAGLRALFVMRVITPSLLTFRQHKFSSYPEIFRANQNDPHLDAYFDKVDEAKYARKFRYNAKFDVCCALTTQGITFDELSPQALLHYAVECRANGITQAGSDSTRFAGLLAWDVLYDMGHFPPNTPPTLRGHIYRGQRSVEQLVDCYPVKNQSVRALLIEYLERRRGDTDYSTLLHLSSFLVGVFWRNVESVAPDQVDLNLTPAVYKRWRAKAELKKDGTPRLNFDSVLLPIRAMYMDIQSWAIEEPSRWGVWAAPCPIPPRDLKGFGVRRRRVKERVDERIRVRQPLLPALVKHIEDTHVEARELLAAASQVELGEAFVHKGVEYRRTDSDTDRSNIDDEFSATVRVINLADQTLRNVSQEETTSFWDWAIIEVLRQTGIRVEELTELTHTSIRQYQRPNGEVVPLLVIAPSKTDRERVIPMSAELFHVVACVIRRLTAHGPVPLVSRYDSHEKTWTTPMPFLFQRTVGAVRRVTSMSTVTLRLKARCNEIAKTNPQFAGVAISGQDLRRLFATEMVNSGLPIHIGAALLGHISIETTRGYVTVFEEDVVRHYQEWLMSRRAMRPMAEYREVTDDEWWEFESHFDKRKVELGTCGRPYGTPCRHEHACVRCPMLRISPKMIPRLDELEQDLQTRRQYAVSQGWLGEIEGIDLTLRFLRDKRGEAQRVSQATDLAQLGMPSFPTSKPRNRPRPNRVKR